MSTDIKPKPMMECPVCGFCNTPTERQIQAMYRKEFGDWPIREMIERGWINPADKTSIGEIRSELCRFFQLDSVDDLDGFLEKPTYPRLFKLAGPCVISGPAFP